MSLCRYKNIFGEPNTGVHSYRLFNLALIDVFFTIIAGLLIGYMTKRYVMSIIILFILGIFFHYIFCVNTAIGKLLFGEL